MSLDPRGATTLVDLMRRRTVITPDAQYFTLFDETVTYARLWAQSARYAAGLAAAGVRAGDKVCLIYPTCAEFFYTFFGAMRLGAVPVPLYPTLAPDATANILRDCEATAVVTIGWFRAGVDASVALAPNVRVVLEPNELDSDEPAPPDHPARPEDVCFLQYTSGSTGQPRGVVLSHTNVVETTKFMAEAAGLSGDDRVVSWLPL
jgi:acyl-CoA synthetase (AMP-forming)/AMP-acid ligase II